jgi:anti-sigma regulatory factor (Ser/Thr protein kinase)
MRKGVLGMLLQVAPSLAAARHCRHWIVPIARECGATPAATTAVELLVSEVVTNAVKYGAMQGTIDVTATCDRRLLVVSVRDHNPAPPVVLEAGPTARGGHGMHLVERMAHAWGVRHHGAAGKTVWFQVALDVGA